MFVVFFTGGATGGHLIPIKQIVREFKKYDLEVEFYWLGPKPRFPFNFEEIKPIWLADFQIRRYFSLKTFLDILKIPLIILKTFFALLIKMPNLVFSKGGSVSFFVNLIAYIFGIPVIIHESDSLPGLSNKVSSYFAEKILISFEKTKDYFPRKEKKEFILTGQPVFEDIISYKFSEEELKKMNISKDEKLILIMGGSQGAREINEIIIEILPKLIEKYQVVHLTGASLFQETKDLAYFAIRNLKRSSAYHVFSFLSQEELGKFYNLASLVISRAGSGSIFEISYFGIPSIIIPLREDVVGPHQVSNALLYQEAGACRVIHPENLKPNILLFQIEEILNNKEIYNQMKINASKFYLKNAGAKIAKIIYDLLSLRYEIIRL